MYVYRRWCVRVEDLDGSVDWHYFATEREAREWINARACGGALYSLLDNQHYPLDGGEVVVESRWPVLQVA